jgi:cytidine deaminase
MTTTIKPVPAEQVSEKDGLIYGVSTAELQSLCEKCIEAKATAYCELYRPSL